MKKATLFLSLFLSISTLAAAPSPVIWGTPYPLVLKPGITLSGSDTTTNCNLAAAGSIRYNSGTFEGCDGSSWAALSGGGGGGVTSVGATSPLASSGGSSPTISLSGTIAVANGGTNSSTALSNNRLMISSGGAIVEAAAITALHALVSDASGLPIASDVTSTELSYLSGATSNIQLQINALSGSGGNTFGDISISNHLLSLDTAGTASDSIRISNTSNTDQFYLGSPDVTSASGKPRSIIVGVGSATNASNTDGVGDLILDGGNFYGTSHDAGRVLINGGFSNQTGGGSLLFFGGTGATSGGEIDLIAGAAYVSGSLGGPLKLFGGVGAGSGGTGGDVNISPGLHDGSTIGAGDGKIKFWNGNDSSSPGSHFVALQVPSVTSDYTLVMPANAGTSGQLLNTDGSGNLSWGPVLLASQVSGTLPVANGGTGSTSFATNGIAYESGTTLASETEFTYNPDKNFLSSCKNCTFNVTPVNSLFIGSSATVASTASISGTISLGQVNTINGTFNNGIMLGKNNTAGTNTGVFESVIASRSSTFDNSADILAALNLSTLSGSARSIAVGESNTYINFLRTVGYGSNNTMTNLSSATSSIIGGLANNLSGTFNRSIIVSSNGNVSGTTTNLLVGGDLPTVGNSLSSNLDTIAWGRLLTISGSINRAAIFNNSNTAAHNDTFVAGIGNITTASDQALFGQYAAPIATTVFAVGNGANSGSLSNAFDLRTNGDIVANILHVSNTTALTIYTGDIDDGSSNTPDIAISTGAILNMSSTGKPGAISITPADNNSVVYASGTVAGAGTVISGGGVQSGSSGDLTLEGGPVYNGDGNTGNVTIATFSPPGTGIRGNIQLNTLGLQFNTPDTEPTCSSTYRGMIRYVPGGTSVADELKICIKDASDAYTWVAIDHTP